MFEDSFYAKHQRFCHFNLSLYFPFWTNDLRSTIIANNGLNSSSYCLSVKINNMLILIPHRQSSLRGTHTYFIL